MPKQTFFNLTEAKREMILTAAKEEFSRALLPEASIANIIKRAEIPRGSFYQYFEDKDDLFLYIVQKGGEQALKGLLVCLREAQGDFLVAYEKAFEESILRLEQGESQQLIKNMMLSINEKMHDCITPSNERHPFSSYFSKLICEINKELYSMETIEEYHYVFKLLKGVFLGNIRSLINGTSSREACLAAFRYQMSIIKRGVYKNIVSPH